MLGPGSLSDATLLDVLVVSTAVPPFKVIVSPAGAVMLAELVCVITLPLVVDAVKDMAPLPVIASLNAIVVPDKVKEPTLVPVTPVVIAPASVTLTFSVAPNVFT